MSWVNDLALGLGVPAGAAAVAVAMCAACFAAEKAARPEALRDIGRILKDPSWSHSVQPHSIVERLFKWTFGERHLSFRCVWRSALATIAMSIWLIAIFSSAGQSMGEYFSYWIQNAGLFHVSRQLFLTTFVADYLALAKTRFLLRLFHRKKTYATTVVSIDVVTSIAISLSAYILVSLAWDSCTSPPSHAACVLEVVRRVVVYFPGESYFSYYDIAVISTVFTSIWTTLIFLSSAIIRLLPPVQRFTAWYFDVETHPIEAIGIVSGAVVLIGSLVWAAVRIMI